MMLCYTALHFTDKDGVYGSLCNVKTNASKYLIITTRHTLNAPNLEVISLLRLKYYAYMPYFLSSGLDDLI